MERGTSKEGRAPCFNRSRAPWGWGGGCANLTPLTSADVAPCSPSPLGEMPHQGAFVPWKALPLSLPIWRAQGLSYGLQQAELIRIPTVLLISIRTPGRVGGNSSHMYPINPPLNMEQSRTKTHPASLRDA